MFAMWHNSPFFSGVFLIFKGIGNCGSDIGSGWIFGFVWLS